LNRFVSYFNRRVRSGFWAVLLFTMSLIILAPPAQAVDQLPSGPQNRGVIQFDQYLVFPENRPGNGVYFNNSLLLHQDDLIITDVSGLDVDRRFVYLARDSQGKVSLGVRISEPADKQPRISEIGKGIYHLLLVLDGVVYKKIYRIVDNKLLDLLPISKTGDGLTLGPSGVAFYHVAASGGEANTFGMRLHVAMFAEDKRRSLDLTIKNTLPRLNLKWINGDTLAYAQEDGTSTEVKISEFK